MKNPKHKRKIKISEEFRKNFGRISEEANFQKNCPEKASKIKKKYNFSFQLHPLLPHPIDVHGFHEKYQAHMPQKRMLPWNLQSLIFFTWKKPCFCNKMELFCWFSNTVLLLEEKKVKENVERCLIFLRSKLEA